MDGMTMRDVVAPPAATRWRLSTRRLLAGAAGVAMLAGAAWFAQDWWTRGRFIETTDDAYVGGDVTAISPHVAGFVAEIAVTDNQRVSAGQVLLRLDLGTSGRARRGPCVAVAGARPSLAGLQAQIVLQRR